MTEFPFTRFARKLRKLEKYEKEYNDFILKNRLPVSLPAYTDALSYLSMISPEKERKMMELYYTRGKTLEETGKILKLSRERIRQMKYRALSRLPWIALDNVIRNYKKEIYKKSKKSLPKGEESFNKKLLNLPVDVLCFSSERITHVFKYYKIRTIEDLIQKMNKLPRYMNFGIKSYKKVKTKLNQYKMNIAFPDWHSKW